jgi:hypothetical protein
METLYLTEKPMSTQEILEFQLSLVRMMSRLENPRPASGSLEQTPREETMAALVARTSAHRPK